MNKRLKTRLDRLEVNSHAELSKEATAMLADIFGRLHALFFPQRGDYSKWKAAYQLRRKYLAGSQGIAAVVRGHKNWTVGHETRRELIAAGLAVPVQNVEVSGLIPTHGGRSHAYALVRRLLPTYAVLAEGMIEHLRSLPEDRPGGYVSESNLFRWNCTGDTSTWIDATDAMVESCIQGSVETKSDVAGHAFYRLGKTPFVPLVELEIPHDELAEDAYVSAFKSEMARLPTIEAPDPSEIIIPLSVTR